eukprot:3894612-Pyramimonas_sp.AAC.1
MHARSRGSKNGPGKTPGNSSSRLASTSALEPPPLPPLDLARLDRIPGALLGESHEDAPKSMLKIVPGSRHPLGQSS